MVGLLLGEGGVWLVGRAHGRQRSWTSFEDNRTDHHSSADVWLLATYSERHESNMSISRDLSGLAITKSERTVLLALCVPPLVSLGTALYKYILELSIEARRQIAEENREIERQRRQQAGEPAAA